MLGNNFKQKQILSQIIAEEYIYMNQCEWFHDWIHFLTILDNYVKIMLVSEKDFHIQTTYLLLTCLLNKKYKLFCTFVGFANALNTVWRKYLAYINYKWYWR